MNLRTSGLLAFGALVSTAAGQSAIPSGVRSSVTSPDASQIGSPGLRAELGAWRAEHGDNWSMRVRSGTGMLEMLYGGNADAPWEVDTNDEAQWFELALLWIERTRGMHGVATDQLSAPRFRYLPLAQGNTTDKITVRFDQVVNGVPVENAAVNVLFDTRGRLLSIHSTAAPFVPDARVEPTFGGGFANLMAARAFETEFGLEPTFEGNERLVHAWVEGDETGTVRLAWQSEAYAETGGQPIGRLYTIDAVTRRILRSETTVHNFDVTGTISANATPGTSADRAANPPVPIPMPRVRVQSSAGTVETDANGNFTFPGVNTPLDLTVTFFGQFTDINNDAGADYTVTFPAVQPNQANSLLMNAAPTQFVTSQANAQLHINLLRDWIRERFPTDPTADFRATSNMNINDSCNAFFTTGGGGSVNFFRASGSCNNTGFSSVVAHEMGHWLNVRYGTGNGSDGMGEGNADVFSMYLYDDPVVGRNFTTSGGAIRNGNNTRQFCGDPNPGCYNGVHANGEVWMGAAWKVRTNLVNSLGLTQGDLVSDLLFLGWMNSYNQQQIRSIIEIQWLTLDDDDGDIENGTPNYQAIDSGFVAQGFPGFELQFLSFADVTEVAPSTSLTASYPVEATVVANLGTTVTGVELFYSVNGGVTQTVAMNSLGGNRWGGTIPPTNQTALVRYWLEAVDDQGNDKTVPEEAPASTFTFTVGAIATLISSNFETSNGGFSAGFPGDDATTGIWVRADPIGTAAQPEDDYSDPGVQCWFTGQGSPGGSLGENDVDGGRTTLVSDVFDASGSEILLFRYARWYHNTAGNAPAADVFDVDVSTDGGATWTPVERVGPSGPEVSGGWIEKSFDLAQIVTPTSTMRVRFVASDLGAGSIVEAAIDEVSIIGIGEVAAPPIRYCSSNPNSTGGGATINVSGSQSLAANNFGLIAGGVPAATFGLFFFGPNAVDQAFPGSQGRLCVDGGLLRLPIVQADPFFGAAFYFLDFNDTTTVAPLITPGSTWNFQFWFRDQGPSGPTSNTSDAMTVEFVN